MKKKKVSDAIAVVGLAMSSVFCLILAVVLFYYPVCGNTLIDSFWGTIMLQVVLIGCGVCTLYLLVKSYDKKREERLREQEKETGLKLL